MKNKIFLSLCFLGICFSGCITSDTTSTTTSVTDAIVFKPDIKTNLSNDIKLTKPNDKTIKINSTNTTICNIDLEESLKETLSSKGYEISSDSKNTLNANVLKCEQNGETKELLVDISFNEAQFLASGVLKDKNIQLVEASALLEEELVFKVGEIF